jgi:hypothetical protein
LEYCEEYCKKTHMEVVELRFRIYDIGYLDVSNQGENATVRKVENIDVDKLFDSLNQLPLLRDEYKEEFAVIYLSKVDHFILGVLTQSYDISLTKFEGSKAEVPINENRANDKTYFFIDTIKGQIYIQNRRYVPNNLAPRKTADRMDKILTLVFKKDLDAPIVLTPVKIEYTLEDFWYFYKNSHVTYLEVKNIQGIQLPEGSVLHNPREDLDEALVESWNEYSSKTVDSFELRAAKNAKINKNPLATLGLVLAEVGKNVKKPIVNLMKIIDTEGEEDIRPKNNNYKIINISNKIHKNDEYAVYDTILKNVHKEYKGRF